MNSGYHPMIKLNILLVKENDINTVAKRIKIETQNIPLYCLLRRKSRTLLAFRERNNGAGDNN
jgi:hypothetical protein